MPVWLTEVPLPLILEPEELFLVVEDFMELDLEEETLEELVFEEFVLEEEEMSESGT